MIKTLYKKLKYHVTLGNSEPVVTTGFFLSRGILLDKIIEWNRIAGHTKGPKWKYWESEYDKLDNLKAEPERLPIFQMGWYGATENQGEFNDGD